MKTSEIEVGDLLTVWSPDEIKKRIGEVPGVESVSVDNAAESATVHYDETRVEVAEIKSLVQRTGRDSAAPISTSTGEGHEGHATAESLPDASGPMSDHSGHGMCIKTCLLRLLNVLGLPVTCKCDCSVGVVLRRLAGLPCPDIRFPDTYSGFRSGTTGRSISSRQLGSADMLLLRR